MTLARQTIPNTGLWSSIAGIHNANYIELYDAPPLTRKVIKQESDIPVQDATTITFTAGFEWFIDSLQTAKDAIVEAGAVISGPDQTITTYEYTGTGVMFTSPANWKMRGLGFTCANGTVFDASGTDFVQLEASTCHDALNVGVIDAAGVFANGTSFTQITGQGFQFTGASSGMVWTTGSIIGTQASFKAFDITGATTGLLRIENSTTAGPVGSVAVSALPNSANIYPNQRALITTSNLSLGGMTANEGFEPSDVRWFVTSTTGMVDSHNIGDAILDTPRTVPIVSDSTYEEVDGGSWIFSTDSRFTTSASGVMTYIGEVDIEVVITGFATLSKAGGGSNALRAHLAKNWVAGTGDDGLAGSGGFTEASTPTSVPLQATVMMSNGDNVRMIVVNETGESDIVVSVANIIVSDA